MVRRPSYTFPFIFLMGLILVVAAMGRGYILASWDTLDSILLGVGIIFLIIAIAIFQCQSHFINKYSVGPALRLTAIIALSTIVLIGVNVLAFRFNVRLDLTAAKQHTLTPLTRTVLKSLNQKIKITVFYVGIPPKYIEDLLSEYKRFGGKFIQTEIVDPLVRLGYAAKFGTVIRGNEKKVFVQTAHDKHEINFKEGGLNEEILTNAIIQLTQHKRNICFSSGHLERSISDTSGAGFSKLNEYLKKSNFSSKEIFLGKEGELNQCDLLIIAGPQLPFSDKEKKVVEHYLAKGEDGLFLIESTPMGTEDHPLTEEEKKQNPTLNDILSKWGVTLGDDLVVDLENHVGQDVGCPATDNYPHHKRLTEGLGYTFFIRPRSVNINPKPEEKVLCAPLVFTSSPTKSWAERNHHLFVKFDENEDRPGPISLGAVVWQPKKEGKASETRLIVIADADFASNAFIDQYSNGQLILNSIKWLTDADFIAIPSKTKNHIARIDLTSKQLRIVTVIMWFVPVMIMAIGILIWWKEKK